MYNKNFYARCIKKYKQFAEDVIPILINEFNPNNVVDIGCGAGMYIKSFHDNGVDVIGYEGSGDALLYGLLPEKVIIHDMRNQLEFNRIFDLCLCVEVAEHIPKEKTDEFLDTLCKASNTIVFTAGQPGQWGTKHVNCQLQEYWIEKFANHGYEYQETTVQNLKNEMNNLSSLDKKFNFFYKNLMVYRRR